MILALLLHVLIVLLLVAGLWLGLQEWVVRNNAAMVDESALAYTGAVSRAELVNQRAHVNRDPRFAQNPANTGFIFFYDCRNVDLLIQGALPESLFVGFSAYDRYAMPVSSMVIDDDVRDSEMNYRVYLTSRPTGARNEIDVHNVPCGTGIIRFTQMTEPELVEQYEPILEAVPQASIPSDVEVV